MSSSLDRINQNVEFRETVFHANSKANNWVENESSLTSGIAENSMSSASSSVSAAVMDELSSVLRGPSALVRPRFTE